MRHKGMMVALIACAAFLAGAPTSAGAADLELLWEIGVSDDDTAELALGPDGYARYGEDPLFVVGSSNAKEAWPYAHPGPVDSWAGSRQHAFAIVFALAGAVPEGECRLRFDLVDTHLSAPPKLEVMVNGRRFVHQTTAGASDDSVSGEPTSGKEHRFAITIPSSALEVGTNEIGITTVSGSWLLYDWLGFAGPNGLTLGALEDQVTVLRAVETLPVLLEKDGALFQELRLKIRHIGEPFETAINVTGIESVAVALEPGDQEVNVLVPAVDTERAVTVEVLGEGDRRSVREAVLGPVRKWEVYLLPHSHVDIGYTHLQTEVEQMQCGFIEQSIALARETATNPPGSRFKWNSEVLWAVESFLKQASPEKRDEFIEAVRKGWIGLDALYGNELTALCRPEELVALLAFARRVREDYDVPLDAAMISDVPGYTWGLAPVMAQSGVKYLSIGPNGGHRIGHTRSAWSDRPFYWVSPSGREKVLFFMAGTGYSTFHGRPLRDGAQVLGYLKQLAQQQYPYDIVHMRYNIGGDNGPPDPDVIDVVKDWNSRYAYPKLILATTSEMFHAFEERYADAVPSVSGDFTPYWEDGAASSARETAVNRASAERLVQAATLCAMLDRDAYTVEDYWAAWREVVLYDEHTWGAHNSIGQPEVEFVKGQWAIKQAFALEGERRSLELLGRTLGVRDAHEGPATALDVFNTSSWPRTDLVVLAKERQLAGEAVVGVDGTAVPSQRLTSGELAFLARDVPAFGAARFQVGTAPATSNLACKATVDGATLTNGLLTVAIDETTGAVSSVKRSGYEADFVDGTGGLGLNDYFYVAGRDPKEPQRNGAVTISTKDTGPLVASLLIESAAPGCRHLSREVRLVAEKDHVDVIDVIDKENVYEKEAVHLAFAFHVPAGVMRMDIPWGVVRPEADQLPGACKNYFTVQRWVDVSNQDVGVTWATLDAPLIEIGRITCDPVSVGWLETIEPSTTLYSYVMNNYWETNYKASQDGPTVFRYAIRPHGRYDPSAATRFGVERSQALIAAPVAHDAPPPPPLLNVEPPGVVVSALKPSEDGKARIVRLFGASGRPEKATLTWGTKRAPTMWLSDLSETRGPEIGETVDVPPYGMVTVRVAAK